MVLTLQMAVLSTADTGCGVQSAVRAGTTMMLELFADSWDTIPMVCLKTSSSILNLTCIAKELGMFLQHTVNVD